MIPIEGGTRSYVLTSYFKMNKFGRCKLKSDHNSGAHYLSLQEPMGNASSHPSLCTNTRITHKLYTSTSHWTGQSIIYNMGIWIGTGGLKPWHNSPTYVAPPLSTIRSFYSMYMTAKLMAAH